MCRTILGYYFHATVGRHLPESNGSLVLAVLLSGQLSYMTSCVQFNAVCMLHMLQKGAVQRHIAHHVRSNSTSPEQPTTML